VSDSRASTEGEERQEPLAPGDEGAAPARGAEAQPPAPSPGPRVEADTSRRVASALPLPPLSRIGRGQRFRSRDCAFCLGRRHGHGRRPCSQKGFI
jgi:hypothetical protein